MVTRWSHGDQILFRAVWKGEVWAALPMTVVRDSADLLALYTAPGTPGMIPAVLLDDFGRRFQVRAAGGWSMREVRWDRTHVLRLLAPGADHSVWVMWKEQTWELVCWYVNLEEPASRTALGLECMDQELDIVISPDLESWRWKDEDHLAEAQEAGFISERRARELRAEGLRVISNMEARRPPLTIRGLSGVPTRHGRFQSCPRGGRRSRDCRRCSSETTRTCYVRTDADLSAKYRSLSAYWMSSIPS